MSVKDEIRERVFEVAEKVIGDPTFDPMSQSGVIAFLVLELRELRMRVLVLTNELKAQKERLHACGIR